MTTLTIDDPDVVAKKKVDSQGRVYLGQDWAGKPVRIIVEELDE